VHFFPAHGKGHHTPSHPGAVRKHEHWNWCGKSLLLSFS
jgi:hypothetical protein